MNKYAYINNNGVVGALIEEQDSNFPEVPITDRYTAEFIASCVLLDADHQDVTIGMLYDPESGSFSPAPSAPEVQDDPYKPEEGYSVTQEEVDAAYREGANDVE